MIDTSHPSKSSCGYSSSSSSQLQPSSPCQIRDKVKTAIGKDINPMQVHMASQITYAPTYFVRESTQLTCSLLRKDLCKITQQKFSIM